MVVSYIKIDPFAFRFEERPNDASIIYDIPEYKWHDGLWRGRHKRSNYFERPMNIYEVHPGSWKSHADGTFVYDRGSDKRIDPILKENELYPR